MKKLISLILAIVLVMSAVTVLAREYYSGYDYMDHVERFEIGDLLAKGDEDVAVGEEEIDEDTQLMLLLETLGIWDDASKSKDDLITMQEFSKILSMVRLGEENSFAGVYDLNPTEEYATYNNAYTYFVEALGYSYKNGQYPGAEDSNLLVAAEIGLLKEKPENINTYITRGDLAKLIYKAMNINLCIMEYPSEGGHRYKVMEGMTLLNSIHNVYIIDGFLNGIPGLNVYGKDKVRNGYIQINRQEIKDGGMKLTEYLGTRVHAYAKYDEEIDQYTLIAIEPEEDESAFEIDFRNITYINNNEISYIDENENERFFDISNLRHIIENGEVLESIAGMCDYDKNEGVIRFTASEKSGEVDTAIIYKYNYYVVNNVDTRLSRIVFRYNRQYNGLPYIQLDEKATIEVYIDGAESDYSQLVSGSIIKIFQCPSTGYTWVNAVRTNEVSGAPETIYDNIVTVEGKEYRLARDLELFVQEKKDDTSISSFNRPKEIALGVNTTFYVIDGIVAGYTSSQSYMYGYIKSIKKDRSTIDPGMTLRIFNQDNEWVEYRITGDIEFEGQVGVSKEAVLEAINSGDRLYDFLDHPIRFRANGENEILALDSVFESSYEVDSDDDIVFTQNQGMNIDWTYENVGNNTPFFVSENTVIMVLPDGVEDERAYRIISNTQMPTAAGAVLVPTRIYNINEYRQIDLLVVTQRVDTSVSSAQYMYVQNITKAVIDKDDQIYGYKVSGKQLKDGGRGAGFMFDNYFYISEEEIDKNDVPVGDPEYDVNKVIEAGDFLKLQISGTDLSAWSMELKGGIVPEPTPWDDGISDRTSTDGGNGYKAFGKFVRANPATSIWVANVDGIEWPSIPNVPLIIKPETKEIIHASVSDFFEGDNVFFQALYGRGRYFIKNEY